MTDSYPAAREPSMVLAAARSQGARIPGAHRKTVPSQQPRRARRLSAQERALAAERIASGERCMCCGGLHAGDELACPRLASFRLNADGHITEGTYWPPGQWEDPERIILAEDANEDDDELPAGS